MRYDHWYYDGDTAVRGQLSIAAWSHRVFPLLKKLLATGMEIALTVDFAEPVKVGLEHLDAKGWSDLVRGVYRRNRNPKVQVNTNLVSV